MANKFDFYALKLCGIMIVVFFVQWMIPGFTELFLLNQVSWSQPWRFLTAIFLHGGLAHLLYNLLALALFGSILERLIGGKRFLIVFFVTGILANIVSVNFYDSSLGASGAIFGVIGALVLVKPMQVVWAFGIPMPVFLAGMIWAIGDAIGIFIPDNIGNIAHLSGMFFGILLGFIYRRKRRKFTSLREKAVHLDEKMMRQWEEGYLR